MGVHNLWKLLSPSGMRISFNDLHNQILGIDTSIWICQFMNNHNDEFQPFIKILRGFFYRILKLLFYEIKPVFVFDGKIPEMKMETVEMRRKRKRKSMENDVKKYALEIFQKRKVMMKRRKENENMEIFSFAKRGEETGNVNDDVEMDVDVDEEDENEEEEMEDCEVEKIIEKIINDGEINDENYEIYSNNIKRKIIHQLKYLQRNKKYSYNSSKKGKRKGNEEIFQELNRISPEEFCKNQQKELLGIDKTNINIEKRILQSIYDKNKCNEEGVIMSGRFASENNRRFKVIDQNKIGKDDIWEVFDTNPTNDDEDFDVFMKENIEKNGNEDKMEEVPSNLMGFFNNDENDKLLKELNEFVVDNDDDEVEEVDNNQIIGNNDVRKENNVIVIDDDDEDEKEEETDLKGYEMINVNRSDEVLSNNDDELKEMMENNNSLLEEQRLNIDLVVKNEFISGIVELLKICGIPYVQSPFEADSQCGYLYSNGLVDGIITNDSDAFLFGVGKVYKNMFSREHPYVEEYTLGSIKKTLGLDKTKLIQLALLLGSDFTDGVKNVGIVNGVQIIDAFNEDEDYSKENELNKVVKPLNEFNKWISDKSTENGRSGKIKKSESRCDWFKRNYSKSKKRFIPYSSKFPDIEVVKSYVHPDVDSSKEKFSWGELQAKELVSFGQKYMCFSKDKMNDLLKPVLDKRKESNGQQRIDSYFPRQKKVAIINSNRLKKAINSLTNNNNNNKVKGSKKRKRDEKTLKTSKKKK